MFIICVLYIPCSISYILLLETFRTFQNSVVELICSLFQEYTVVLFILQRGVTMAIEV